MMVTSSVSNQIGRLSTFLPWCRPRYVCAAWTRGLPRQYIHRVLHHRENASTVTRPSARLYTSPAPAQKNNSLSDLTVVYRFPYIVWFRLVCRAKLYQTGLVICSVPLVYKLHEVGNISTAMLYGYSGVVTLAAGMLFVMGEFFRRVVGIISVDSSMSKVRISHLTFWGKRNDFIVDADNIIPLSDQSENLNEFFVTVKFYDGRTSVFLFHKHGVIDQDKLLRIIG